MKLAPSLSFLLPLYTYLVSADIEFLFPSGGETIPINQNPINIEWYESKNSPLISQLKNYNIRLFSGSDDDPALLSVMVVDNNGPIPDAPGNATYPKTALSQVYLENFNGLDTTGVNSFFFGVASQFRADPNTSVIDFSPRFSLASIDQSGATTVSANPETTNNTNTTAPERIFLCNGVPCTPSSDLLTSSNNTNTTGDNSQHQAGELDKADKKQRDLKVFIVAYVSAAVVIVLVIGAAVFVIRRKRERMGIVNQGRKRTGKKGLQRLTLRKNGTGLSDKRGIGMGGGQGRRWSQFSQRSEDSWNGMG